MKKTFAILVSLIAFIFSNQTAKAYEYDTWCIDKTTYFRWGPYLENYVNSCKELDSNFVDISETLFKKLSERDHRGNDLDKTSLNNKKIFETHYPLSLIRATKVVVVSKQSQLLISS